MKRSTNGHCRSIWEKVWCFYFERALLSNFFSLHPPLSKLIIHFSRSRRKIRCWHYSFYGEKSKNMRLFGFDIWTGGIFLNDSSQVQSKQKKQSSIELSPHTLKCTEKNTYRFDFRFGAHHFPFHIVCSKHWNYPKNVRNIYCHFRNNGDKNYWSLPIFNVAIGLAIGSKRKS